MAQEVFRNKSSDSLAGSLARPVELVGDDDPGARPLRRRVDEAPDARLRHERLQEGELHHHVLRVPAGLARAGRGS